tara:strand:- start:161 stop:691 length:531 start_codon:yes stop_codon:yes gene_type:complete
MTCELCEILEGKGKAEVLYQDAEVVIAVRDNVVTPGQITVFPKQHLPILETVPNKLLEKCAIVTNKVSVALFEGLGGQGTNIIVRNGLGAGQNIPHFSFEVIPRVETDGLNLQWEAKQLMEDEMEMTFALLKEEAAKISLQDDVPKEKPVSDKKEEKIEQKDDSENYLLKSLKRLP